MRQPVNRAAVFSGRVDMATRIHHAIWILAALLAPACGQDEATIEYTVNGPEPAVAVRQLDIFAVVDGRKDSSATVNEGPIQFPQLGAMSWFDDQARSGVDVHICAVAESQDATFAGVSPAVRLAVDHTMNASLMLAPLADRDDLPTPCSAP